MYSFFARIFEKPVCAILDECQNAYNKLSNAAPSLFSPKYPFFELKCRVKKNVKKSIKNAKRREHKKSRRGTSSEPVALPKQKSLLRCVMDGIDFAYRYSEKPTMAVRLAKGLKDLYENAYPPLTEHKCLFTADDLSDSLIYIRKVGANSEPLPPKPEEEDAGGLHKYFPKVEQSSSKAQQEESDLQENVAKVDQPAPVPTHCKHPNTDKEEDDFILISTNYEDDDYIFLY